jgi:hypothetical protein
MTNVLLPVRAHEAERAESASGTVPDGEAIHPMLSPELALVDPELAAVARMLLPDPVVPERTRPTSPALRTAPPRPLALTEQEPAPVTRTPARRIRLAAVAATGLAAFAAGAFGFALAADHSAADETRASADASRAALQTQAARQARAARTYTWPAVPRAEAYEFEILRGKTVVFETTTQEVAVELPPRVRLSPGRYTWSVTPTLGNRGAAASGRRPVVEGTFEIVPS